MSTYLKSNNNINLAHLLVLIFLLESKLIVEDVGDDKCNKNHDVAQQHNFEVLVAIPRPPRDQVVGPLVHQPVDDAEKEQDREAQHLIDVECVPKHN